MDRRLKSCLFSAIGFVGTTLVAQPISDTEPDSIRAHFLDEVVITGQVEPQSVIKSVHRIRVLSAEQIKAKGATRIQDVLNTELNIRFTQDLALGSSNISMMGLSGQNVKVLLDGVPVIGRQGTSNAIDINQININSIDRIEIVEGPMSVIYGADALAGVINIITKKPEADSYNISVNLHEETVGTEYGGSRGIHNQNVQGDYRTGRFYFSGTAGRNAFGGWKGNAEGREMEWHPKLLLNGSGLIGYRTSDKDIYYRGDYTQETITNPGEFSGIEAIDMEFISTRLIQQVQAAGVFNDRFRYTTAFAYTDFSRKTQTTTVNKNTGDVRLAIGPGLQDVTSFDGLTWRGTIQTKLNSWLLLEPGFDINTESGSGGRLKPGVNKIADYAAFLLADITALKTLNLRPGVRVLKNSAYKAPPAVTSLNIKYTINRAHDLRMAYGRGFRAPSLRELHFNFFDASHSIEGNPDLEAELSHSINGSWNWSLSEKGSWQIISVLSGFYNSVDNMIATGVLPGSTNTTYINIENYQTQGGTLGITAKKSQFDISIGYGYTGRLNRFAGQNPSLPYFTWTGEATANISHFLPKAGLRTTVNYKYTGKTPFYELVRNSENNSIIQLAENDGFHWADCSVQKNLWTYLTVMFGIRNVFDIQRINSTAQAGGAHSSSGPRPIGYGRSYYASVTFNLFD